MIDSIDQLFEQYLIQSYNYYVNNDIDMLWSDTKYDEVCRELYNNWDNITHKDKDCIDKEILMDSTGHSIKYPDWIWKRPSKEWIGVFDDNVDV